MNIKNTRLQNFRRILSEKNIKLKDIANRLDKAPSQVSAFGGKNPTKGIGDQIARQIENALGLHDGYLDMPHGVGEFSTHQILSHTGRKLPVLRSVPAAAFLELDGELNQDGTDEWIESPGPVGPRAFILLIEGISMYPHFIEGDKVVVDPSRQPLPSHYVAVKHKHHHAITLRQLKQEGTEQYLVALNADWPDRIVPLNDIWVICGRAMWKITDL
ncbi:S24 family peptidase [Pseudomonas sp. W2Oct36]|uniref:S24 family peptidase n=1 Tax=Pseudomonas sp. W2Oct36 TaxID=1215284 RepID=UPI0034E0B864